MLVEYCFSVEETLQSYKKSVGTCTLYLLNILHITTSYLYIFKKIFLEYTTNNYNCYMDI